MVKARDCVPGSELRAVASCGELLEVQHFSQDVWRIVFVLEVVSITTASGRHTCCFPGSVLPFGGTQAASSVTHELNLTGLLSQADSLIERPECKVKGMLFLRLHPSWQCQQAVVFCTVSQVSVVLVLTASQMQPSLEVVFLGKPETEEPIVPQALLSACSPWQGCRDLSHSLGTTALGNIKHSVLLQPCPIGRRGGLVTFSSLCFQFIDYSASLLQSFSL